MGRLRDAMFPQPKPEKRVRDKKYLEWVATKPCLYCGGNCPVEVHHVRKYGWGATGRKPDDYFTIPLAPEYHDMAHNDPETFGRVLGIEEICETITSNIRGYIEHTGGDLEGFKRHMAEAACGFMKRGH